MNFGSLLSSYPPLETWGVENKMDLNPIKLLLVDDDEDDYIITKELLSEVENVKYEITWIPSYHKALEIIPENLFDVCLFDYRLGINTGIELLQETNKLRLKAPVIILTGQSDKSIDMEAMKAGASDYLVKGQMSAPLLERSIRYAIEQQRNLETLRRNQELFMEGPVTVFKWIASPGWPVEYVSSNISQFYYFPADFIDKSISYTSIIHHEDLDRVINEVDRYSDDGYFSFEQDYRIINKNGEPRWIYDFTIIIRDNKGLPTHYYGYILDITERKMAESALKESEEKYRKLIENIQDGIFVVQNNMIQYVNDAFAKILGYTTEDLIFQNIYDFIHSDYHQEIEDFFKKLEIGNIKPHELEIKLNHFTKVKSVIVNMSIGHFIFRGSSAQIGTIKDITERKKVEETLRLAANVFKNTSEGIMVTDVDGFIESVNPAFTVITGYSDLEALGKRPSILKSGRHDVNFYIKMWESLRSKAVWQGEIWNRRKDGEIYPQWLNISAIKDSHGKIVNYVGVFSDITKIKLSEQRLNYLAYHDALTGLPNRLLFHDRLQQALSHAQRNKELVAIIFFDLDRFKIINDTLGHAVGDLLLRAVAKRLMNCVREGDTVARLGGDEFIVIVSEIKRPQDAAKVSQKILQSLSSVFSIEGQDLYITASLGIAIYPDDGDNLEHLLKNADTAMYHAKEKGKNTYQFYASMMTTISLERLKLETNLRRALDRREFYILYQPIVDLISGEIIEAEALIYWKSGKKIIPPTEFISVAEDTGMIIPIGSWVLKTVCEQNKQWQMMGYKPISIAVNLSSRQFQQSDLIKTIDVVLSETQLDAKFLELELTESIIMHDAEMTINTLQMLKTRGIKISIDDFGTGYSSLSYLKKFPIDKLKIDRSFVQDIVENQDDASITKAVIAMGHNLRLQIIAEGVENYEQLKFLYENFCDKGQGYLFSRPVSSEQFEELLKQKNPFQMKV